MQKLLKWRNFLYGGLVQVEILSDSTRFPFCSNIMLFKPIFKQATNNWQEAQLLAE